MSYFLDQSVKILSNYYVDFPKFDIDVSIEPKSQNYNFLSHFKREAKNGKNEQINLGFCYLLNALQNTNNVELKDTLLKLLIKYAKKNNNFAQYWLALYYISIGDRFSVSCDKCGSYNSNSWIWLIKSCNQNNSYAQNEIGNELYDTYGLSKTSETMKYYDKSLQQNNSFAQANVGYYYYLLNKTNYLPLLKKSVAQENSLGQYYLGIVTENNDPNYAIYLFKKSADQGLNMAQLKLFELYSEGGIVRQNMAKSLRIFQSLDSSVNNLNIFKKKIIYYYAGNPVPPRYTFVVYDMMINELSNTDDENKKDKLKYGLVPLIFDDIMIDDTNRIIIDYFI